MCCFSFTGFTRVVMVSSSDSSSAGHNSTMLLKRLRSLMRQSRHVQETLQAYIIPGRDAHGSEYLHEMDKRREFITGFLGSRGTAVVTQQSAAMWTDGRYWIQARKQMDAAWTLMREGAGDEVVPTMEDWLVSQLGSGGRVGVDPRLMAADEYTRVNERLESAGLQLVAVADNLIDVLRAANVPPPPTSSVFELSVTYAGMTWEDKVNDLRSQMAEKHVAALLLSALDEVAWLFNLRGSDIPYNPVFFAYAIITHDAAHLFVDQTRLQSEARASLASKGVRLHDYDAMCDQLEGVKRALAADEKKLTLEQKSAPSRLRYVWLPSDATNQAAASIVPKHMRYQQPSPVQRMKAIKNEVEMEGFRLCHIRDAVAHCEFFHWLEGEMKTKEVELTEMSVATQFENLRKQQALYMGLSFDTISAVGAHAAMPHYKVTAETDARMSLNEVFLCDSGGQYLDGTTDTTRTVVFREPRPAEKEAFTRVLQGHITLANLTFPNKTSGYRLDAFARASLWRVGLDFNHGTGHGIGHFLNVHEGPAGFHKRQGASIAPIEAGMVLTIEPGYYLANEFGIRIENAYAIATRTEGLSPNSTEPFLGCRALTLVPIQRSLIDAGMLSAEERRWVDDYHRRCAEEVGEELRRQGKTEALAWLLKNTVALEG